MDSRVNAEGGETCLRDGREWRIGTEAQVSWIKEGPSWAGDAIPAVFDAYATVELPGTGYHQPTDLEAQWDGHNRAVLTTLSKESAIQPWWLGFLETGARTWLFSTLWDDDWSCVGGSRSLIDAFLASPELKGRVREIDPSMSVDEVCPPGHEWF